MQSQELKSNSLLLLAAAIWGFAFVAQRIGAKYLGSFTFNGIRFALGALSLIPLILLSGRNDKSQTSKTDEWKRALPAGIIAGAILFSGASLQQVGLVYTSAGKAAFITGLYIVLVPVAGVFLKHSIHKSTWVGVAIAALGLFFLCITENFRIAGGDLLELVGAFFWTAHILLIGRFARKVDALKLSFIQFMTCSGLSLVTAFIFETISLNSLSKAVIPLLYGGILSVGVAYTLQVVGQKYAKPSHASVVLSMETVFAALGGAIILHENLGTRGYIGCALMLFGMLLTQLQSFKKAQV